jgi:hypothetical protein
MQQLRVTTTTRGVRITTTRGVRTTITTITIITITTTIRSKQLLKSYNCNCRFADQLSKLDKHRLMSLFEKVCSIGQRGEMVSPSMSTSQTGSWY